MDPRRSSRAPSDPMVRQVGFVTPRTHPASPSRSHSVPADVTSSSSPPSGDLSAAASLSPVMIPPPRHSSVPFPIHLRRDNSATRNLQIPIGSYNPINDSSLLGVSPRLVLPSSSRFDAGSEFYDDVSVSTAVWGGRVGGGDGKEKSSFPGSSGEMMAMKAAGGGGNANVPAKSVLTTASVVKMMSGITGCGAG